MNNKITNEQIIDVYLKIKEYCKNNEYKKDKQKNIVDKIKKHILGENKFLWNDASLTDYIEDLFHMIKGRKFVRTINSFAETYFIENICNDFDEEICKNAKDALVKHKIYYKQVTAKRRYLKKLKEKYENKYNETLEEGKHYINLKKNGLQYSFVLSSERSIAYGDKFKGVVVELLLKGDLFEEKYNFFKKYKQDIEKQLFREDLIWQPKNETKSKNTCRIFAKKPADITDAKQWNNYIEWQINTMKRFVEIFSKFNLDNLKKEKNQMIKQNNNKSNKIKNIILYGVPGVGKTYSHKKLIDMIESKKNDDEIFSNLEKNDEIESNLPEKAEDIKDRVKFITFHQSFGYEDFIEGFRPNEDGDIKLQDGVFKAFCDEAKKQSDKNFYFVIDEINRANISKVFGELITLIEEDKRKTLFVTLPYSKESFSIPENIYIIGTMNSTDKSIALIDIALRRRFTFLKMKPNLELVENEDANKIMKNLNEKIKESLGEDYQIGHSYFMGIEDEEDLSFTCKYKIKPLLEEYFYGDKDGFDRVYEAIKDVCKA